RALDAPRRPKTPPRSPDDGPESLPQAWQGQSWPPAFRSTICGSEIGPAHLERSETAYAPNTATALRSAPCLEKKAERKGEETRRRRRGGGGGAIFAARRRSKRLGGGPL
ncbi:unnamed protein product, partial [Prorocentrum cordatum]